MFRNPIQGRGTGTAVIYSLLRFTAEQVFYFFPEMVYRIFTLGRARLMENLTFMTVPLLIHYTP